MNEFFELMNNNNVGDRGETVNSIISDGSKLAQKE